MKISTKANRKVREAVVKIFFARNGVKQLCLIEDLPQLPDIDFEGLRAVDKKISFNVLQRFDAPDFEIPGIVYNMNEFDGKSVNQYVENAIIPLAHRLSIDLWEVPEDVCMEYYDY
jgi:hypothetical protein